MSIATKNVTLLKLFTTILLFIVAFETTACNNKKTSTNDIISKKKKPEPVLNTPDNIATKLSDTQEDPQEVEFVTSNGDIRLGVQFFNSNSNKLNFTFSVSARSLNLNNGVKNIDISFYNEDFSEQLTSWISIHSSLTPVRMVGAYATTFLLNDQNEVNQVKSNMKNLNLVFKIDSPDTENEWQYFINFNKVCEQYPYAFINIDNGKTGCSFDN